MTTVGVAAITRLAGKVSVKVRALRAGAPAGLVMVKVSVAGSPVPIPTTLKALVRVGRACTTRLAVLDTGPVGAWLLDTPDAWLVWVPTLLLNTTTDTVQLPLSGIVRPVKVSAVWPFTKLLPPAPAQVPPAACAPEMVMFVRVSLKPAAVRLMPFMLLSVKVMVEVVPWSMVAGPKALAMVGDAAVTVNWAVLLTAPMVVWVVVTPLVVLL